MKSEVFSTSRLKNHPEGTVLRSMVLPDEIDGVSVDFVSVTGEKTIIEKPDDKEYSVLLFLKGNAILETGGGKYFIDQEYIFRIPYSQQFAISVGTGKEIHFILFRKRLENDDLNIISETSGEHSSIYFKALADCPVYTEDIKSSKSLNRMILPAGKVPRFCMGSVESAGPDEVGAHEHPMLDQHFIGLKGCNCIITADDETIDLTENMIVHIPLGSKHSVCVKEGDLLSYIWCDFFFTLKGQDYMEEQHRMEDD